MAFDQAMEADRIDDFGLFSAIVHAPLWILGSILGSGKGRSSSRCHDDNEKASSHGPDDNADSAWSSQTCSHNSTSGEIESSSSNNPLMRARAAPLLQAKSIDASPRRSPTSSMDVFSSSMDTGELYGLLRTKKMSWSDESGQRLVEYADESTRLDQSSSSTSSAASASIKPVRSAMRRSRSLRSTGGGNLEALQDRTRYIPKMTRAENSLIMPTRPYGSDPSGNGVDSPQWGWYTNITPPTPEMYYSQSSSGKLAKTQEVTSATTAEAKPQHNQVFQNLQGTKGPMGWPSVPI